MFCKDNGQIQEIVHCAFKPQLMSKSCQTHLVPNVRSNLLLRVISAFIALSPAEMKSGFDLREVFPQEENFKGAAATSHSSTTSSACVSDFSTCRSSPLTTLNVLLGSTEIISCNGNATSCGHGCLMTGEGSVCVCPEGSLLQDNGDGCTGTAYNAVIGSYVSVNYY